MDVLERDISEVELFVLCHLKAQLNIQHMNTTQICSIMESYLRYNDERPMIEVLQGFVGGVGEDGSLLSVAGLPEGYVIGTIGGITMGVAPDGRIST